MIDRRRFTLLMAGGAVGLSLPSRLLARPLRSQETFFDWREVAPGVRAAFGQGGNVLLVADGGEALVSDAKNLGFGHTLRREAEAFGTPVTTAINTHHHGDHVGGNVAFARDLPLVAHPAARRRVTESAGEIAGHESERIARTLSQLPDDAPARVRADLEEEGRAIVAASAGDLAPNRDMPEGDEVRVGAVTVLLRHVGSGHTDNDVFLHLPDRNVLHTGDLLFVGRHGFMDQNGGVDSEGWQRSVQAMVDLCDSETVVVPGHGEITDRAGLRRQYDYFGQLRDAVEAAVAEGRTKEEVQALRPEALADVEGSPARNLGVVYDEVTDGRAGLPTRRSAGPGDGPASTPSPPAGRRFHRPPWGVGAAG